MKAIIPAAGLGTRFLPGSKCTPKEMLPVLDKPVIQYVVEEALDPEEVDDAIIVTSPGKPELLSYFQPDRSLENLLRERGKNAYADAVAHAGGMPGDFRYQYEPKGLGHDQHGGGCANKGASAAAGAGVVLIIAQLLAGDAAGFFPCVEFADLLERQELVDRAGGILHGVFLRQGMGFHDTTSDDDGAHFLEPPDADQHGGNGLVAACDEYAAVKSACVRLRRHQIDDGFTVGE